MGFARAGGPVSARPARRVPRLVVGWREWVGLPDLGIASLKAKVDTGARSSALHAFDVERFEVGGEPWVRFSVHPRQRESAPTVRTEAPWIDERVVRSSSGTATRRPVIRCRLRLGTESWPIEVTLVRRDLMGFRMLLGRQALRRRCVVDPGRSYLVGGRPAQESGE